MERLSDTQTFKERQNIVLEGFDPISAGGFTQLPNAVLNDPTLSFAAKVAYAKLLSYAWSHDFVYPGQERMAANLGCAVSTVSEAITELKQRGWLDVIRRGQGQTNIYVLKALVKKRRS